MTRRAQDVMCFLLGVLLVGACIIAVMVSNRPQHVSHTPTLLIETRHALRYAEWCGGVVEITPLFGGGHDVVVKGCDQ